MNKLILAASVTFFICQASADAQIFECVIVNTGVDLYGTNNLDQTVRCEVTCTYWHPDGSEGYQKCKVQMPPKQKRSQMCSWNLNDAKTTIGESHSCQ